MENNNLFNSQSKCSFDHRASSEQFEIISYKKKKTTQRNLSKTKPNTLSRRRRRRVSVHGIGVCVSTGHQRMNDKSFKWMKLKKESDEFISLRWKCNGFYVFGNCNIVKWRHGHRGQFDSMNVVLRAFCVVTSLMAFSIIQTWALVKCHFFGRNSFVRHHHQNTCLNVDGKYWMNAQKLEKAGTHVPRPTFASQISHNNRL